MMFTITFKEERNINIYFIVIYYCINEKIIMKFILGIYYYMNEEGKNIFFIFIHYCKKERNIMMLILVIF